MGFRIRAVFCPDRIAIYTLLGKAPVCRNAPDGWPHRSCDKPLRLPFPIMRARGAHGRILLQNSDLRIC